MKCSSGISLASTALFLVSLSMQAQQPQAAQSAPRGGPLSSAPAGRQALLDSPLHQRAVAAGGKLEVARNANPSDLAQDLPSLVSRSDEVVLVHLLTSYGGLSADGSNVQSHYDVLVIQSWKGTHLAGDVLAVFVPAGGLLFPDGARAETRVNSFLPLRSGGRYLMFLHGSSSNAATAPSLWLVGDGVQGAFLLHEQKVHPAYAQGALWKAFGGHDVAAFLAELDVAAARQ
jgi:hypothetical protein